MPRCAGTLRADPVRMRWIFVALVAVAACTCPGQRYVAVGHVDAAHLGPELAACAGSRVCFAPCIELFQLTASDTIETCQVVPDVSGGARVTARYIAHDVCGSADVLDPADGDIVIDDGTWDDWDGGDDGSIDDGSTPPDDGSTPPDDGSTDDPSARQVRNAKAASWAPMPEATNTLR
jgi:hypothetical protein